MEEIWKSVNGHSRYEISNYGIIRNKYSKLPKNQYEVGTKGHLGISLDGICYSVHRLVASHFIENDDPENKNIVNHLDENPKNNRSDNLEWCTFRDNIVYGTASRRGALARSKEKVYQYDENGNIIKVWDNRNSVKKEYGNNILKRRDTFNRYYFGYFWFFEDEEFDNTRFKPVRLYNVYRNNELILENSTLDYIHKKLFINTNKIRAYYNYHKDYSKPYINGKYIIKFNKYYGD